MSIHKDSMCAGIVTGSGLTGILTLLIITFLVQCNYSYTARCEGFCSATDMKGAINTEDECICGVVTQTK